MRFLLFSQIVQERQQREFERSTLRRLFIKGINGGRKQSIGANSRRRSLLLSFSLNVRWSNVNPSR